MRGISSWICVCRPLAQLWPEYSLPANQPTHIHLWLVKMNIQYDTSSQMFFALSFWREVNYYYHLKLALCKSYSGLFLSILCKQNIFINSTEVELTLLYHSVALSFCSFRVESKNLFKLGCISAKGCFPGKQCKQINDWQNRQQSHEILGML